MPPLSNARPQITRVAVYGIIHDERGMLLCRLLPGEPHFGRWTLPGGGVDFGEDLRTALRREVFEETGLEVEVGDVLNAHSQYFQNPESEVYAVRILFAARVVGGTLTPEADGTTDCCAFIPLDEVCELPIVPLVQVGYRLLKED
ncbi:MAG: NUDIX domain-containing protein [Armatimonadetes bacterium]|nr:NUDIX domain-containing protein [Armatimonadota bacterium]